MTSLAFRMPGDELTQAKNKAGLIPLSRIIRILIRKWLSGEITITQDDIATEQENE